MLSDTANQLYIAKYVSVMEIIRSFVKEIINDQMYGSYGGKSINRRMSYARIFRTRWKSRTDTMLFYNETFIILVTWKYWFHFEHLPLFESREIHQEQLHKGIVRRFDKLQIKYDFWLFVPLNKRLE